MRIHDPILRNMAQALSLSVFIAVKGTNIYILVTVSNNTEINVLNYYKLIHCSK